MNYLQNKYRQKVLKHLLEIAPQWKTNVAFPNFDTVISKIITKTSEYLYLEDFIKGQEKRKQIANLLQTGNKAIASISLGDSKTSVNLQKDPKLCHMIQKNFSEPLELFKY